MSDDEDVNTMKNVFDESSEGEGSDKETKGSDEDSSIKAKKEQHSDSESDDLKGLESSDEDTKPSSLDQTQVMDSDEDELSKQLNSESDNERMEGSDVDGYGSDGGDIDMIKSGGGRRMKRSRKEVNITLPKVEPLYYEKDTKEAPPLVKVSNVFKFDSKKFEERTFEFDEDNLNIENDVRWRMVGKEVQSNARYVTWSDGSHSLVVGNEYFDALEKAAPSEVEHLYSRTSTNLACQQIFDHKITFRPVSMDSVTHRRLMKAMSSKTSQKQRIAEVPTYYDFENKQKEEIRKEEEHHRDKRRIEARQRKVLLKDKQLGTSFLEEGVDEDISDADDIMAIKRGYKSAKKKGISKANVSDEDSEGVSSESEEEKISKAKRKKRQNDSDESSEDAFSGMDTSESDTGKAKRSKSDSEDDSD